MNFTQLIKERYSVRDYLPQGVEDEKLEMILNAGRLAPTAANKQPQRFLVVKSPEGLGKISLAANIYGAPLAIVVCGLKNKVWVRPQDGHPMTDIDPTIATDHMMLQAQAIGLGSCWITWFDPAVLKREFSFPETVEPVNILALGYARGQGPSPERHQQQRLPLADFVWHEKLPR